MEVSKDGVGKKSVSWGVRRGATEEEEEVRDGRGSREGKGK